MSEQGPPLTLGMEEEYLLVDLETRGVEEDPPAQLFEDLHERTAKHAFREFMRSQIEITTPVCRTVGEARIQLGELRRAVVEESAKYGLAPIAASSHPFSLTSRQRRTDKERYLSLLEEMQGAIRRMMICGLHVHIGVDDDEARIDTLNQLTYFLPHLLALSCSSPFWEGERTGLMSFRLMIFNGLPRTGLPQHFSSWGEYCRNTDILVETGIIADTSRIWWDLRPSLRYPTLETRVMDCCTRMEDALSLAALIQCLVRMLHRLRRANQRWRTYSHLLLAENRWRAMRYSFDGGLLDLGSKQIVPFAGLLEELIEVVREDAEALDCVAEVEGLREIVEHGTSAHRQIAVYEAALASGATEEDALRGVVDWLVEQTART
jgi:carboxylate-amine ligase